MNIYVILLLYIHFSALSNAIYFSAEKSWKSALNIDQWMEWDIWFKLGFKTSKETRMEICKTSQIRNIQSKVKPWITM